MAEAGFTQALALYEGRTVGTTLTSNQKAEKDALLALKQAEKYGITYYVLNERFYNFVRPDINLDFFNLTREGNQYYDVYGKEVIGTDVYNYLKENWMSLYEAKMAEMFGEGATYVKSSAYGGNFASDEPALPTKNSDGTWDYGELEQLYWQVKLYQELMAEKGIDAKAYVNLLPYESMTGQPRERYEKMLEYYCKNIGPLLGYISYDQYPLNTNGVNATHLLNLEIVAQYCKAYGLKLHTFLWSKTKDTGHRAITSANDLRFQMYSNLAFGSTNISYYTYTNHYTIGESSNDSLIDFRTGQRSQAYYWAKEVNNEIHALEDAYCHFTWESVMYKDVGDYNIPLHLLEKAVKKHSRLTAFTSTADILIGNFKDEDGKMDATDGFMVVNYTDPITVSADAANEACLTFANATHVLVYQQGKSFVKTLKNGETTISLLAGEGVFVIPFNK